MYDRSSFRSFSLEQACRWHRADRLQCYCASRLFKADLRVVQQ
jgi:hypothetical protein